MDVQQNQEHDPNLANDAEPFQLVNRLWKKYDHLASVDRRVRIIDELKNLELPEEVINRLIRELG